MTNREAVIAEVQLPNYDEQAVDKALIDVALPADSDYSADNAEKAALAAIKVLRGMLSLKSISEGGFSITLQVEQRIADLQTEYGLIEIAKPSVTARNVW